jgi:hypothetical protein
MRGYRVLRFANEDFLREPDVAMDAIGRAVMDSRAKCIEPTPPRIALQFDPPSRGG